VGDQDDEVKVFFDPPILSIAGNLHLRIGALLVDMIYCCTDHAPSVAYR